MTVLGMAWMAFGGCVLLGSMLAVAILWAAGGIQAPGVSLAEIERRREDDDPAPSSRPRESVLSTVRPTVKWMSWNIAFAHGVGSADPDFVRKPPGEIQSRLARIAALIRDERPEIVFLQEVDRGSRRSHDVDQFRYLLEHAGLPFGASADIWRANYIPHPPASPRNHLGRTRSAAVILSRYEILHSEVWRLPKPRQFGRIYNLFYLFRYWHEAIIAMPEGPRRVAHVHLEAFDDQNRDEQIASLGQRIAPVAGLPLMALGGDFNASEVDLGEGWHEARDEATGARWPTFPADAPNSSLDHLWWPARTRVLGSHVIQTGDLSDHLPLIALTERR